MKFDVHLLEEDQLQLETLEATVNEDQQIEFLVEGSVTDVGSETLETMVGKDIRPVTVTFEVVN